MNKREYDVAIIGGGPAGSTVGSLLRLYNPDLRVAIFERESFPRDHVGESQLPAISHILDEMGAWDKIEAAQFPVKVGATYRWGRTKNLWDLDFLTDEEFEGSPRPSRFDGQRRRTAFQVDRSVYDQILLDHAKGLGCEVFEGVKVSRVLTEGDRVTSLDAVPFKGGAGGEPWRCEARHFVDASGDSGLIRRALGIPTDSPTSLRNIAIWDYWDDARWAETIGHGGTRAQSMSLGWGWLWFFPISPTRTSVGLVLPAERFKGSDEGLEETYLRAILEEPLISKLLADATRKGRVKATKDWSFLADRLAGENWFLVGDSCGFADPILTAGLTLAHSSARGAAYAILEMERGELDPKWVRRNFSVGHRANIRHHIQFADFWYSANGCFTDLKEHCSQIAKDAGLELQADAAFRWLGTGGFTTESLGEARGRGLRLSAIKFLTNQFISPDATWEVGKNNVFILNLAGASVERVGMLRGGRILQAKCFRRDGKLLPLIGFYQIMFDVLKKHSDAAQVARGLIGYQQSHSELYPNRQEATLLALEVLEAMIAEGWVTASRDERMPVMQMPRFRDPKLRSGASGEAKRV